MNLKSLHRFPSPALAATLVFLSAVASHAFAEDTAASAKDQERAQIQLLRSDAPPGDKAIACKKLAVYGSDEAVPFLSPLLSDEHLASWARIALENIPGSAPDDALRKAAGKLHGRLLVGVINSLGVRRDAKSVSLLAHKLNDNDTEVADAAAVSLGKIGGRGAGNALRHALTKAPEAVRPSVAEGSVRCAERFLAEGQRDDAIKMYDAVVHASLPGERTLEGLRGAILARGDAGIPLLLAQLHSSEREYFNLGLRVARELPGPEATAAVASAFNQASAEQKPLLLLALADREDPAATPIVMAAAKDAPKVLRLTAIDILDRSGDSSALPVLLTAATDDDSEISEASLAAITRMAGADVDSALLARLPDSSGKMRCGLITLASRRGVKNALPQVGKSLDDPDSGVRGAAIQAMVNLGGANEVAELAHTLEKSTVPAERAHIENVLVTLSGHVGASSVPPLLELLQRGDADNRKAALRVLVAAGGGDALAAVVAATGDSDSSLQDEAVRALASWPEVWPEDVSVTEPLMRIAKAGANSSHQILALRAYLQFLLGDEKLGADDKLARLEEVTPLLQRPEEKITAIAVLQGIPASAALDRLATFASDPAVADDACAALVQAASQNKSSLSPGQRQKALQVALQSSTKEETKKKAQDALKSIQ